MGIVEVLTLALLSSAQGEPRGLSETAACSAYWNSRAVFAGELVDITRADRSPSIGPYYEPGMRRLTFRVERSWRGDVSGEIPVYIGEHSNPTAYQFTRGERYLVYTAPYAPALRIAAGSRTRPLSEASTDLRYLESAERPSSGGKVMGRVRFDDDGPRPAAGFRVTIGNEDGERSTETNPEGVFVLDGIAKGRYGIKVDVPPPGRARGPAMIELADARACAVAEFTLGADGAVELFVLDQAGKPVVRTTLELIDADSIAQNKPRVVQGRTYADGSVGWGNVRAGRYVIGLNVTLVPDPARPQHSLFYPGVPDLAAAHTFEVGPGERVELDTLRLPPPPARLAITGAVLHDDGSPVPGADIFLRSAAPLSRGKTVGRPVKTRADGTFAIPGIAGQRYFVEALVSVEGRNARPYASSREFVLSEKTGPLPIVRTAGNRARRPDRLDARR